MRFGPPLAEFGSVVACDTETTGLSTQRGDRPFLTLFMDEEERLTMFEWVVDPLTRTVSVDPDDVDEMNAFFGGDRELVFHHGKFDVTMLRSVGVEVPDGWNDTMIAARVLRSGLPTVALKPLAKRFAGIEDADEEDLKKAVRAARRKGRKLGWKLGPKVETDYWMAPKECRAYGGTDVLRTICLWFLFREEIAASPDATRTYQRELDLQPVVLRMEDRGVMCRPEDITSSKAEVMEGVRKINQRIFDGTGNPDFNPRSSAQLIDFFHEEMKLPVHGRTKTGLPKTDKDALAKIDHPVARAIEELRTQEKMVQFFESWMEHQAGGILHSSFEPTAAVTGRFSSRDPCLHQVPKRNPVMKKLCRKPFRPREGYVWIAGDFTQMELYMLAGLAKEQAMLEAFRAGRDIHAETAIQIWGQTNDDLRFRAKAATFGISYGAGPETLGASTGLSVGDAADLLDGYLNAYSGVATFMDDCQREAKLTGAVLNPFGRRVEVSKDAIFAALNYKIQSSGADVVKEAMIRINNWLRAEVPDAEIVLQIHDEVVLEVPKARANIAFMRELSRLMSLGTEDVFGIPLRVDLEYVMEGRSWSRAAPVNLGAA